MVIDVEKQLLRKLNVGNCFSSWKKGFLEMTARITRLPKTKWERIFNFLKSFFKRHQIPTDGEPTLVVIMACLKRHVLGSLLSTASFKGSPRLSIFILPGSREKTRKKIHDYFINSVKQKRKMKSSSKRYFLTSMYFPDAQWELYQYSRKRLLWRGNGELQKSLEILKKALVTRFQDIITLK